MFLYGVVESTEAGGGGVMLPMWSQQQILDSLLDLPDGIEFGTSLALQGDLLAVGAPVYGMYTDAASRPSSCSSVFSGIYIP